MHIPTESGADSVPVLATPGTDSGLPTPGYGLRREVLSPMETLAQSVSTMAPTTTPAATIPLVCALAGNSTWLAYALATAGVLLVAWCIGQYARQSASPGSLYSYAAMTLPRWLAASVAWSLLLAYVATGSSVIGGFYHMPICCSVTARGGRPWQWFWPPSSRRFPSGSPTAT
jgi:amino acid transporter